LSEATAEMNSILIVDDDDTIRTTLAAILEQEGYEVELAKSGAEAIKISNEKLLDLALIDMRLPDMNGTEILGRLKERIPKTIKIMVTGYPSLENAVKSVNEGADGYLLKPVDAGIVLGEVRRHIKKREEDARYSEKKVAEFIRTRISDVERDP
jgi:DNA-binding NtrC family response regulator